MATLAEQLVEAESAYHELVLGKAARVVVDKNGERVEFTAANRQGLYSYIQSLKAQIATAAGTVTYPSTPARFIF